MFFFFKNPHIHLYLLARQKAPLRKRRRPLDSGKTGQRVWSGRRPEVMVGAGWWGLAIPWDCLGLRCWIFGVLTFTNVFLANLDWEGWGEDFIHLDCNGAVPQVCGWVEGLCKQEQSRWVIWSYCNLVCNLGSSILTVWYAFQKIKCLFDWELNL